MILTQKKALRQLAKGFFHVLKDNYFPTTNLLVIAWLFAILTW